MSQMKALIADDNAEDRRVLRYYLNAQGAVVHEAVDGAEGYDLALEQKPDLIISDALMPNVDGFQFLRNVRNAPALLGTPFIFYSAVYTGQEDQELALSLGADAFIVKPKDPDEFWQEVQHALEEVALNKRKAREEVIKEEALFLKKYSTILAKKVEEKVGELRVSEERFRDMVENSPDWFWEFDREANFTYVSPRIKDLLGYETEEILGKNAFDLMSAEEAQRVHRYFDPTAEKYQPFAGLENIIQHKDGHEVVLESSATPILSPDDEFQGYRGIDRDITDRKRIDDALRQSEERYRSFYQKTPVMLHSIDCNGRLASVSDYWLEVLGYERAEVIGRKAIDFLTEESRREAKKHWIPQLFETGVVKHAPYRFVKKSGQIIDVLLNAFAERDASGALQGYAALLDITERKRMEEQLHQALVEAREARDQYDALLRSVADGLIITDGDNRIILLNHAAEDLLGLRMKEALGKPLGKLVKEQALIDHVTAILTGGETGVPVDLELVDQSRKEARIIQAMTSVAHDLKGGKTGAITILHDVTPERESDRLKNEFISTAAHELRTPLTSVLGYAELLTGTTELETGQQKEFLSVILKKSRVLERIVDDLLNLSRVESGRMIYVEKGYFDLGAEIEQKVRQFQREFLSHHFELEVPQQPIMLWMDEGKITQAMENLLTNAIKFSPEQSLIKITCEADPNEVQVSIQDEGIGMTPEQVERVFDKFYRADTSDTARQGLGLGMTIVKSIIKAHEGEVWVKSEPGKGTMVCFTLPLESNSRQTLP